jgi:arylsulfatase A
VKTDGLSLVPVLLNKGKRKTHNYFYWEFHENDGRQAISWKNWKAIRLNVSTANPSPVELYDIAKDPEEKNNLAGQYPDIVKKMYGWMMKAHVYNQEWPLLFNEKNNPR